MRPAVTSGLRRGSHAPAGPGGRWPPGRAAVSRAARRREGALAAGARAPQGVERHARELIQHVLAEGARRWEVADDAPRGDERLEKRLPRAVRPGRPLARREDDGLERAAAAEDVLGPRPLATLRHRSAFDLHDVEREVQHGRVGDRGADAVAVDDRVEGQDLVLVDATGGEDLHVTKAAEAELPTDLLDDPVKVAPARRGRVEPHRVEVTAERLRHADRLELLVLQGVDQGDAADFGIDDVVKALERFHL